MMTVSGDKAVAGEKRSTTPANQLPDSNKVVTSLIAGASAGAIAKTVIAPLDRTKINFQITNRPFSTKKALLFLLDSYRTDGLSSLWRGNSATMARVVPYAAIQFCAHEQWKVYLEVDVRKYSSSKSRRFLAGSLAGVTAQTLTYPLDLARARMAVTRKSKYRTFRQIFLEIVQREGPFALYRGWFPTMLGVVPYAGTSFFTYETLKIQHAEKYPENPTPNPVERLAFGAVAGLVGQSASYPLDIVRRRMQTTTITGQNYTSILGTLVHIYKEEGIWHGWFKGLSMNWVKGPIAVGVSFATFDTLLMFLRTLPPFGDT